MTQARPTMNRQTSLEFRLTTPKTSQSKYRSLNNLALSSSKYPDEVLESYNPSYLSVNSFPKALNVQSPSQSIYQVWSPPTQNSLVSTSLHNINRKLTKGYTKFMEDKLFLDRRNEEKSKIEKELAKTLSSENPLVMSRDIQNLITSSIVNNPMNRPKTVFKLSQATDDNHDDMGRDVVQRIYGNKLDDNLLFMKVQHGHSASIDLQSVDQKFIRDASKDKVLKKEKRKIKQNVLKSHATSLINIPSRVDNSNKNIIKKNSLKIDSLNGLEAIKGFRASDLPGTLDDLDLQFNSKSSRREPNEGITPLARTLSKISQGGSRANNDDENVKRIATINMTTKSGLFRKLGSRNSSLNSLNNVNNLNNYNSENKVPLAPRVNNVSSRQSLVSNKQVIIESRAEVDHNKGDLNRINKLCKGIIKSSSRLGTRLKKGQDKAGKDFKKLSAQWENYNHEVTLKNWEKSIKNVEAISKRSSFFNFGL